MTALMDNNGSIVGTYYYDAFGNITGETGEVDNPIRYAGYQYDEEGILVQLRIGEGLDEEKFKCACSLIKELTREWKHSEMIPKKLANIFMDLHDSIKSCIDLYGEEEADKITDADAKIWDLAIRCLNIQIKKEL